MKYPTSTASVRPIQWYDERKQHIIPHRCYASAFNAHNQAMIHARWYVKVGDTISVIDVRFGKLLGQYTREEKGVSYMGPRNVYAVQRQEEALESRYMKEVSHG